MGKNLRTNVPASQMRNAVSTASMLNPDKTISVPIVELMTTGNIDSHSVVKPTAGLYEYAPLRAYIAQQLSLTTGDKK